MCMETEWNANVLELAKNCEQKQYKETQNHQ